MDNTEKWVSAAEAVKLLRDAFSTSQGAAEAKLLEVCQSGHIRAARIKIMFNGIGKPGIVQADIIPPTNLHDGFPKDTEVSEDDFQFWLEKNAPRARTKIGRKRQYDRGEIETFVVRLMNHHGDFRPGDRVWDAQARLEEKISDKFGIAISTLRGILPPMLRHWRSTKVGN